MPKIEDHHDNHAVLALFQIVSECAKHGPQFVSIRDAALEELRELEVDLKGVPKSSGPATKPLTDDTHLKDQSQDEGKVEGGLKKL